jgi:two-component system chemotaxis sensor kinase CheA
MNLDLKEFHAAFFEEAGEHLTTLEEGLLKLETAPDDKELINGIFRSAHSIKGTGGALGFSDIAGFTHDLETVLDRMRNGEMMATATRVELLLRATDALTSLLEAAKDERAPDDVHQEIAKELQAELSTQEAAREELDGVTLFGSASEVDVADNRATDGVEEAAEKMANAADVVAVTGPIAATPPASREIASKAEPTKRGGSNNDSIRVSVNKVEDLINLVGELVIANSMVQQAFASGRDDRSLLKEALVGMERTTRQLQEEVMGVRMMPIATVFRRFPRIVRDLAAQLGKSVHIEMTGEDTELDKQVIEEIGDPLTHLVRNAVDHGLESAADRVAAGKSEEGRIDLRAYHEGGNVIVEIADDGKGIDATRVRQKAVSLGLISADEVLTEEQTFQLIMRPGFSTAEKITDVSGRGVGMDVVKRNVEALNGNVSISSARGKGSCFRIKLPLTMAILDGLALRLGDDVYVLPLLSVIESLRPSPTQIVSVAGNNELLMVRGEPLPLLKLHRLFDVETQITDPCSGLVVIVEHQGRKYGVLVDELIGQLQVVMKSLEANYRRVDGVSGATILGDGRVALIIDIPGLVRVAFDRQ